MVSLFWIKFFDLGSDDWTHPLKAILQQQQGVLNTACPLKFNLKILPIKHEFRLNSNGHPVNRPALCAKDWLRFMNRQNKVLSRTFITIINHFTLWPNKYIDGCPSVYHISYIIEDNTELNKWLQTSDSDSCLTLSTE